MHFQVQQAPDLFGEQIPDHIHLHLIVRDRETKRTIRFIQSNGRQTRKHARIVRPALGDSAKQILKSFEQAHDASTI